MEFGLLNHCFAYFQEEDVFEIVDFTSASEWEAFTSKLEEILLSWQLSLKDNEETPALINLNGQWKSDSKDINFAGINDLKFFHQQLDL